MRVVLAALIAVIVGTMTAEAQEYRWCAEVAIAGGSTQCSFTTLQQCQATVAGTGGFCRENASAKGPAAGDQPSRKKKRQ